jgi:hypothetical protein
MHLRPEEAQQLLVGEQTVDEARVLAVAVDERLVEGGGADELEVGALVGRSRSLKTSIDDELAGDAVDDVLVRRWFRNGC